MWVGPSFASLGGGLVAYAEGLDLRRGLLCDGACS